MPGISGKPKHRRFNASYCKNPFSHKSDYVDQPMQQSCKLLLPQIESFEVRMLYCNLLYLTNIDWGPTLCRALLSKFVSMIFWKHFLQSFLICSPKKMNQHGEVAHPVILKWWTLKKRMKMNACVVLWGFYSSLSSAYTSKACWTFNLV